MTDNELRGAVLRQFYNARREQVFWPLEDGRFGDVPAEDVLRICTQLAEHALIKWQFDSTRTTGYGSISAYGVDVVEGMARPAISIQIDQSRNVTVFQSPNAQVGDGNKQGMA